MTKSDYGETRDCPVCEDTHEVHFDGGGFTAAMGFDEFYIECPEYGTIVWTED